MHGYLYLSLIRADEIAKNGQIASVPEYYAHLYNQCCVSFQPTPKNKTGNGNKQDFKLVLDRTSNYNLVATVLASKLNVGASKIRFTSSHPITNQPREVIQYKPGTKLEEMLPNLPKPNEYAQFINFDNVVTPVMYYEVMDVDVADLESKRSIDVNIIGPTLRKETKVTVLVSRVGSVHQLLDQVITKGKMDIKDPTKIRLFEAVDGKVTKEFSPDQTVDNVAIEKQAVVYAEVKDFAAAFKAQGY